MVSIKVVAFTARFESDFKKSPSEVQRATRKALMLLTANPVPAHLRLHSFKWESRRVFKIDVFANHSWQISFELSSTGEAKLRRLATHKAMDRAA
jgi:hypothetical protein